MFLLAVLVSACSCGCERHSEAAATAAKEPASPSTPAAPEAAPEAAVEPSLPPPGTARVLASERGFTLLANRVEPLRVLRQLERATRVHVELGRAAGLRGPVTLRLVDVPLEELLAELLPGVPFLLHFAVDPERERTVLAGISLGELPGAGPAAATSDRGRERDSTQPRTGIPELTPEEVERRREESLARLADPDPEVRAGEVTWLEPEGEGLGQLEQVLDADPDPEVRIAATLALADGDSFGAVNALLKALSDPDPRVVIAALDALEFAADETVIPRLQPVLEHPAGEVREKVVETIGFLSP